MDQGNLRYAFLEGVLSFELAIEEFSRKKLKKGNNLFGHAKNYFKKLSMKEKVVIVATFFCNIPTENIENALEAIEIRNKIVHEGKNPSNSDIVKLSGLLNITTALLEGPKFRFPSYHQGNASMSSDQWDVEAQKKSKRI